MALYPSKEGGEGGTGRRGERGRGMRSKGKCHRQAVKQRISEQRSQFKGVPVAFSFPLFMVTCLSTSCDCFAVSCLWSISIPLCCSLELDMHSFSFLPFSSMHVPHKFSFHMKFRAIVCAIVCTLKEPRPDRWHIAYAACICMYMQQMESGPLQPSLWLGSQVLRA